MQLIKWNKPAHDQPVILVERSGDAKLGTKRCDATYVSQQTCPGMSTKDVRPCEELCNGCYAEWLGMVPFVTRRLNSCRETDRVKIARAEARLIDQLVSKYRKRGTMPRPLRLHVVGDTSTNTAARILSKAVDRWQCLVARSPGRRSRVWSYTHAWAQVLRRSFSFDVLASLATVDTTTGTVRSARAVRADLATARRNGWRYFAIIVDRHLTNKRYRDPVSGLVGIPCPAQFEKSPTRCADCRICSDAVLQKANARAVFFASDRHGKQAIPITLTREAI